MRRWWFRDRKPEIIGNRPIDADLKFYSAYARLASRPSLSSRIERWAKLFMWAFVFFYAFWCIFDRNFGERPTQLIAVGPLQTNVQPGDRLYVRFDLIRHKICEYDMSWTVIDSTGKRESFVEPHKNATGLVGRDTIIRPFQLPDDMAAGPAKIRMISSWACPNNAYEAVYPMTMILPDIHFNVVASGNR